MAKTFAQYLIDSVLPKGMEITKQVDKKYLKELLTEVAREHEAQYDSVVSGLKLLGDRFSTLEPVTMGMAEISVPDREKRDAIIRKYQKIMDKETDNHERVKHLGALQDELGKLDMDPSNKDDATVMVRAALGKAGQLMKLRTSPGVVMGGDGKIIQEIFPKSYAEGVDPLHFWLGATESRKNIAEGQVNTAKPGEMNKVMGNILSTAVVSREDCGTKQGILLYARDDDVQSRYLARDEGQFKGGTLITADVQQAMLKAGLGKILVRSPQTCSAPGGSVCQKCMGIRNGTAKPYEIGDNAGLITAGNIGEPLTQMVLSSKHAVAKAREVTDLEGEAGFRQFMEMPKNYPNRKVLCEVVGEVWRIRMAPQGGKFITIRMTRPVPSRYIELARPTEGMKNFVDYHIPPNLKVADDIREGMEVYPGLALSTGVDNLKDIARLRNLGFARSASSQNMYDIYKRTGQKLDRRHFELLARAASPYVKLLKVPSGFGWVKGEVIEYQEMVQKVSSMPKQVLDVDNALGKVLGEGVLDVSVGTEIDQPTLEYLKNHDVKQVKVVNGLEVAAQISPMTRVVNQQGDWLGAMNHRYLKTQLKDAASLGKKSNIHGFNPVTSYAYGVEMGQGKDEGRY